MKSFLLIIALVTLASALPAGAAPVSTQGFLNLDRPEAAGTLLSHPSANDSANLGRTTTINYVNGWLIVGGEVPGSLAGSDYDVRVYDISNPAAPVRRRPLDFELSYPGNRWQSGNSGWNAHGSAQSGPYLLPGVLRVQSFGGPVEMGGTGDVPPGGEMALGYNRSSQAGPWVSTLLWYGTPDQDITIQRASISPYGAATFQTLATFDHTGVFGGGDWHPMFFGDLLIYARSGGAARDGVVVYRLQYQNFEDANPANDTVSPQLVGSLQGGFQGYWPTLFSDGSGLYVIGSATDILTAANITPAAVPGGDDSVTVAATLTIPGFSNASYPVFQDQFGFIHNRKINMTSFLAGDPNPIALTLNQGAPNNVDTSQMSLPLGNLWITGGYPGTNRSQGMAVWVHQQERDTTPPRITYHIPQANRSQYPRHAPLSFLLHEHPRNGGLRNGIDFTVRQVLANQTLGAPVAGYLIHDFSGVVTFTPTGGLAANTTYQVNFVSDPLNGIGFVDAAGNAVEPYSFRFSTGADINAASLPSITAITSSIFQPAPNTPLTVTTTATGTSPLEYRFNFSGTWTAWSPTPSAAHFYAETGRPRVLVQVRDASGNIVTGSLNLLVLTPPTGSRPTNSSTMTIGNDPAGRRLWVVNPDADTVSVLDPVTGAKIAEHIVGLNPRSIARDANGRYWVTCHKSDDIRVLNPDGTNHAVLPLPYGAAPFAVAPSPDGQSLFVTLYGSGQLRRYSAANPSAAPTIRSTFATPRAIAVSGNGQRVLVTRFISPDLEAEVAEFAGTSPALDNVRTFSLSSANPSDGGDRASGVPNYLAGIAISPDGTRAAVVSKQDNVLRGPLFGVGDLTHETTVRSVVSFLDLTNNQEIRHSRRDFDNSDSPSAVTYSPLGDLLLVALQGNNRVVGIDTMNLAPVIAPDTIGSTETSPAIITLESGTGLAPQGVLIDPVSQRFFSQDFMGRTVTVRNAAPLLAQNLTSLPLVATTGTVANEQLASQVLLGKRLFYNAADPRMSADSYISCASCHLDGGHDGRVWDFTGRGEGFRRTPDLRGHGGMGQGNVHWTANFDEIQDFEHDIRGPFGGTGFLPGSGAEFAAAHPSPATTKAGLSPDLDAIAAYLSSLGTESIPKSPDRNADGTLTAAAVRGRNVFTSQSCVTCHSGTGFTESALTSVNSPSLRNVGTLSALSGQRLNQTLPGIDTPTLNGLHGAGKYLHHGEATTLSDVFSYAGGLLLYAAQAQLVNAPAVAALFDNPLQGGGGYHRGALGGSWVSITGAPGNAVRFNNVNGGPAGGLARISIRYAKQYSPGTARLRINGVDQTIDLLRQYPDNNWQISGWRWLVVEAALNAGVNNTIEVQRLNDDFHLNAIMVSNAADRAAAAPHAAVQSLSSGDRSDLIAYLRQLDGRSDDGSGPVDPNAPVATLSPVAVSGGNLTAPFVDFDIFFSGPVTGLDASDFAIGGTAGFSHTSLTFLGDRYRLRVTGFTQPGSLTVQLPANAVSGAIAGSSNPASTVATLTYAPPVTDNLALLSDEFNDSGTLSAWARNETAEGWNAGKLEQWNIDTTTPGHMRLMPYSSTWYQDFTGAFAYKQVTGDFVITTRLNISRRNGQAGRPTSDYSLAGLMVRAPRAMTAAAPQPNPGPGVVLPWPPPAQGQPGHFVSDWQPATENYIFLSVGFGTSSVNANPNIWQYEVKTTTNGVSTLYPRALGVPENEGNATLQIVRRGSTFLLLRRHGNGQWIIENRFERPDLPQTLQVGITCYTDWNTVAAGWNFTSRVQPYHQNRIVNVGVGNPDLVADVDFFRIRRPDSSLLAPALQSVPVTGPSGPVRSLAGTAIEPFLGSAAGLAIPSPGQTFAQWLGAHLPPAELASPSLTDPLANIGGNGLPSVLNFLLGGPTLNASLDLHPALDGVDDGSGGTALRYLVRRNPEARGWRVIVETSTNLVNWTEVAVSENGSPATGIGAEGEIAGSPPIMVVGPGTPTPSEPRRFYRIRAIPSP